MSIIMFSWAVALSLATNTAYSQCVNSSSAEVSLAGVTMSHVIGQTVTAESEDGRISAGQLAQYSVSVLTGEELTGVFLTYIYPNPTEDILLLHAGELRDLSYAVIDMRGVVMASATIGQQEEMVDFSAFQRGSYTLILYRGTERVKTFGVIKR